MRRRSFLKGAGILSALALGDGFLAADERGWMEMRAEELRNRLQEGIAKALRQGATAAKIRLDRGLKIGCSFEAGRLKETSNGQTAGYWMEALVGDRRGGAYGNRIEDLNSLWERSLAIARTGSAAHFRAYPPSAPVAPVPLHSPSVSALPRERLIEVCREMIEPLRQYDKDLFLQAGGGRSEEESFLVTSGGVNHVERRSVWWLDLLAQRTRGTDILFAGYGRSWRDAGAFFEPAVFPARVLDDLRLAEKTAKGPNGPSVILVPPETLGEFLWGLGLGFSGKNVIKGDSPLKDRLGEKAFAEGFTLRDNPHRPFAPGAVTLDEDGVPTQPVTLVESGVIRRFLFDLDTAGLAGVEATGHKGCQPYVLEVEPGSQDHRDMLLGIKRGILVKSLMGFGQSNILNGDFSCNVALGYGIENGELTGRVKDTMVAGNLHDLFRRAEFSRDRDPYLNLPWAYFPGVQTSSKE